MSTLIQKDHAWLPTHLHGEVAFPGGSDVETIVKSALKSLVIPSQIPLYDTIKYSIKNNLDGTQSIFFEVS